MPREHDSIVTSFCNGQSTDKTKEVNQEKTLILRSLWAFSPDMAWGPPVSECWSAERADLRSALSAVWGQGPVLKRDSPSGTPHENLNLNNESVPLIIGDKRWQRWQLESAWWEQVVFLWRILTSGSQSWLHIEITWGAFIKLPMTFYIAVLRSCLHRKKGLLPGLRQRKYKVVRPKLMKCSNPWGVIPKGHWISLMGLPQAKSGIVRACTGECIIIYSFQKIHEHILTHSIGS